MIEVSIFASIINRYDLKRRRKLKNTKGYSAGGLLVPEGIIICTVANVSAQI
jgi:hypothetical protein